MSDGPAIPPEMSDQAPKGRSRYEDYDLVVPASAAPVRRRTPTLTLATAVLAVSGVLPLLTIVLFHPARDIAVALGVLASPS